MVCGNASHDGQRRSRGASHAEVAWIETASTVCSEYLQSAFVLSMSFTGGLVLDVHRGFRDVARGGQVSTVSVYDASVDRSSHRCPSYFAVPYVGTQVKGYCLAVRM